MATDLERLVVQLEASLTRFDRDMRKATGTADRAAARIETRFERMNARLGAATAGLARGIAAPFLGLLGVQAIIQRTTRAIEELGSIGERAGSIGLSTDFFQTLGAAGLEYNVTQDEINRGIEKFTANLGAAANGQGTLVTAFKKTNPELLNMLRNAGTVEEAFLIYADAVKNASGAEERANLGRVAFGKSWAGITRVMDLGSEGLRLYTERAREMGLIVDAELIKRADEISDKYALATQVISLQFSAALVELAPVLLDAAQGMADMAKEAREWAEVIPIIIEAARVSNRLTHADFSGAIQAWNDLKAAVERYRNSLPTLPSGPEGLFTGPLNDPSFSRPKPAAKPEAPPLPSTGSTPAEQYNKATEALVARTEALRVESSVVGASAVAAERARVEQDLLTQAKRLGVPVTKELTDQAGRLAEEYAIAADQTRRLEEAHQFLQTTTQQVLSSFIKDIRNGTDAIEALGSALDSVADKLIDMAVNKLVEVAFQSLSGTTPAGGGASAAAKLVAGLFHGGGVVGSGGAGRRVPAGVFVGAPRLHGGLMAGEYPAILQRGETVTPKGGWSGGPTNIRIINNGQPVEQDGPPRQRGPDIEIMIKSAVGKGIARGDYDGAMGGRYGATPRGRAR